MVWGFTVNAAHWLPDNVDESQLDDNSLRILNKVKRFDSNGSEKQLDWFERYVYACASDNNFELHKFWQDKRDTMFTCILIALPQNRYQNILIRKRNNARVIYEFWKDRMSNELLTCHDGIMVKYFETIISQLRKIEADDTTHIKGLKELLMWGKEKPVPMDFEEERRYEISQIERQPFRTKSGRKATVVKSRTVFVIPTLSYNKKVVHLRENCAGILSSKTKWNKKEKFRIITRQLTCDDTICEICEKHEDGIMQIK